MVTDEPPDGGDGSIRFDQSIEMSLPPQVVAFLIPYARWSRVRTLLDRCEPAANLWHSAASLAAGIATAIVVGMVFLHATGEDVTADTWLMLSLLLAGSSLMSVILFISGRASSARFSERISNVREEMDEIQLERTPRPTTDRE